MAVSGPPDKPAGLLRHSRHGDVKKPRLPQKPAVQIDFVKKPGVTFDPVAAFRGDSFRTFQMKKVTLAFAAVLALGGIVAGCATPAPEKPAPVIRKG
jgi:hypothetical protein